MTTAKKGEQSIQIEVEQDPEPVQTPIICTSDSFQQNQSKLTNLPISASKRKLDFFAVSATTSNSSGSASTPDTRAETSSEDSEDTESLTESETSRLLADDEYVVISVERLKEFSRGSLCPSCMRDDLKHYAYHSDQGMAVEVTFKCQVCGHELCATMSSNRVDADVKMYGRGTYDTHKRTLPYHGRRK